MYAMRFFCFLAVGIMTFAHAQKYFAMIRALITDCSLDTSKKLWSTV
jgi:hypothetical protein